MGKRTMNSKNYVVDPRGNFGKPKTKRRPELCNLTKSQRERLAATGSPWRVAEKTKPTGG